MADGSILIVEDHTMIAEYVASILADAGYEPIQATSLRVARQALAQRRFDAWVCDRFLPDGESQALLFEHHDDVRHAGTPAIVLSADMDASSRRLLLDAGFADALIKPCPPVRLLDALRNVLAGRNASTVSSGPVAADGNEPVLDDEGALLICAGNPATLVSLRRLFAADLPAVRERLAGYGTVDSHHAGLRQELHQLSAAAAWCGAAQVKACCERLRDAPERGPGELDLALQRLQTALR